MSRETTEKILDEVLRFVLVGGSIGTSIVLPNVMLALEKPMDKYLNSYNKREREREAKRVIYYMKAQGYLRGEYEHGLAITNKGKNRLEKLSFDNLSIARPQIWDKSWRIVFYDIPEEHKNGRDMLTAKLHELDFFQLQRSVWIHPFPCRDVIEKITNVYAIDKYVSYIETTHIDNEKILIRRFKKRLTVAGMKFS